jgi:hypothetical protein
MHPVNEDPRMATTDAKLGFRLPWGQDRAADDREPEGSAAPTTDAPSPAGDGPADAVPPGPASQENENDAMIDAAPTASTTEAAVDAKASDVAERVETPAPADPRPKSAAPAAARKPNKFLADLTRAMQAAAESARTETLERLSAEAKTVVESIHSGSSGEATELRKRADDDVAAVREWSKNEIARIREETDERIAHRKARLEHEIEEHAARIEARVARVQERVAAFETEMQAFFERLLDEQDPTRFASLAESLPEPPPLDGEGFDDGSEGSASYPDAQAVAEPVAEPAADEVEPALAAAAEAPESLAEPAPAEASDAPAPETASTDAWPTEDAAPIGHDAGNASTDARLAALGLDTEFATAEAEALDFTAEADGSDEPMPDLGDDIIAARLAGIVSKQEATAPETADTRVVVVGLVSVASIAGFKRHLSRVQGVSHVGVTSGPEGEFIFAVTHDASISLRDAIPGLPGFAARVTGDVEGGLAVTAHDPETDR